MFFVTHVARYTLYLFLQLLVFLRSAASDACLVSAFIPPSINKMLLAANAWDSIFFSHI